jgi:hypothetical protein
MGAALVASAAIMQAGVGVSQIIEGGAAEEQQKAQGEIEARARAERAEKLLGKQTMAFLKSGVGLSGTPQTVFEETEDFALEDMANIRSYYRQVGKQQKRQFTFQGLSSIAQAGFTASSSGGLKKGGFSNILKRRSETPTYDAGFNPRFDYNTSKFTMEA